MIEQSGGMGAENANQTRVPSDEQMSVLRLVRIVGLFL